MFICICSMSNACRYNTAASEPSRRNNARPRNLASVSDSGPVDAWLNHNRGMALLTSQSLKNVKPAQLAFLHAVEIEPNNAKAISGLALGVLGGGMWHVVESREDAFEESHQLALKAYSLDHADPFVNFVLGQTYQRTERHDLALESLQQALNVTPGNPEICAALSVSWLSRGGRCLLVWR